MKAIKEVRNQLEEFKILSEQLVKAFTDVIPEEFLNDTERKIYNSISKKVDNVLEINDAVRVAEAIILYTRAEYFKQSARISLSTLCCFKHQGENETLTLYMPSYWTISKIHKKVLNNKSANKYLHETIFNEIKRYEFPIVPEERLKLRIQNYLRRENGKTLFDFIDEY
jgi:hypothetical protein